MHARWYSRRRTVRIEMRMLIARETLRYGKRKLKDIQPLADCAGCDTMMTQRAPVTGHSHKRLRRIGAANRSLTDGSE